MPKASQPSQEELVSKLCLEQANLQRLAREAGGLCGSKDPVEEWST
jgi:hypothetical protein